MPIRQFILLLGLFVSCVAVVGIAWATRDELYLFVPIRRAALLPPPTHPGVILGGLFLSLVMTYWFGQNGLYVFFVLIAGIWLGSIVGFFVFGWTPSWAQHVLAVDMVATGIYAWQQQYYFDD